MFVRHDLWEILDAQPVLRRVDRPDLGDVIDRAHGRGRLARVLPGIFTLPERSGDFTIRVAAAAAADPNLTFVRRTAARLTWWPELPVDEVQAAGRKRRPATGFRFEARSVPTELRHPASGAYVSCAELSTLELSDELGGSAIDEALRRRVVSLGSLTDALELMPCRAGNVERARLLRESRHEPWSELERDAHVRLRRARITGWRANLAVVIAGERFFLDAAFPGLRLALEFDGWQFHRSYESFVNDRRRDVLLALAGWTVLRFTAATIGEMADQVRESLRMLSRG